MDCPRCQHDNPAGVKFCGECGARLESLCPACHAANPLTNKFCHGCGQPLTRGAPAGNFTSPQVYTPKHLAEKILTWRSALEGERKQVTVLFADLKGSMELLADRDPEEARTLLDPVLEHMMEAVHRYEGTVNQVMGDGIMALFGAPLAQEDHAVRACYAALHMQGSVRRYAAGVFRSHGVSVRIRVGLNSGEVVVRTIGSDLHMDYTAIGQTTHLAARMEQMAEPGTIFLSLATLALAEGFVEVTARGPVPVKGLAEPVEVFELTGANPVRSRLHAAAAQGLTRFVGRETELALLRQALTLVGSGRGQVVAIVGEPGVGKSRLVWEFTHSHRGEGWLVLEAASVSYGKAATYFPVIDLLRTYFQIEPRDEVRRVREKVTGKLLSLDRALEAALPVFFSLLDVLRDDPEWGRLEPSERRRLTLDGLKRLFLRESQVQPVVLVFEDLHWVDTETQALLDLLVDSLPTAPVLLLVNYRPEYTHGWGSKTFYQQLRLDTLPAMRAIELLDALLGDADALGDVKRLLIERTQGNPFFLEESVRALVETKALTGSRGAYALTGAMGVLQLPATAQAILAARIDRLRPEDKRLLQAAAVIGKDVPYVLLQAIAEVSEGELRAGLARLQAAEFLYETRLFPELEYTFKHALTHEVAYIGVLRERLRALHARLVEAIEQVYAARLDEHVERLAHHAFRAEMWGEAAQYLRRAAAKSMARSSYQEARSLLEQAVAALKQLPESRDSLERSIDVRFELRSALLPSADFDRILECLREAEVLSRALNDEVRHARVQLFLGVVLWSRAELDDAVAALAQAAACPDDGIRATGHAYLAFAQVSRGEYRQAFASSLAALAILTGDRARERLGQVMVPAVVARVYQSRSLIALGELNEAMVAATEGLHLAEAAEQETSVALALREIGGCLLARGETAGAIAALERAVRIARDKNMPLYLAQWGPVLASAYVFAGRIADGAGLLEEVVEVSKQRRLMEVYPIIIQYQAEAMLRAGRAEHARELGTTALERARAQGQRGLTASTLLLLGEVAMAMGAAYIEQAVAYFDESISLAQQLGMRPLVAHGHLGLGTLYGRAADGTKAQEHLRTAATMYREMGMTFWLEKAEAALGPPHGNSS